MLQKTADMQIHQYILQLLWTFTLESGITALHFAKWKLLSFKCIWGADYIDFKYWNILETLSFRKLTFIDFSMRIFRVKSCKMLSIPKIQWVATAFPKKQLGSRLSNTLENCSALFQVKLLKMFLSGCYNQFENSWPLLEMLAGPEYAASVWDIKSGSLTGRFYNRKPDVITLLWGFPNSSEKALLFSNHLLIFKKWSFF